MKKGTVNNKIPEAIITTGRQASGTLTGIDLRKEDSEGCSHSTGSGNETSLPEISNELAKLLASVFQKGNKG